MSSLCFNLSAPSKFASIVDKLVSIGYEWVRGRFDVICCIEGDAETVVGMKVAFINTMKELVKKFGVKLQVLLMVLRVLLAQVEL